MNPIRPILIATAVVAVLAAAGVATIFAPPVQQWAVRRVLGGDPGLRVDFAGLAFGPFRGEVVGLEVVRDGVSVSVARLEVDYAASALLWRRELELRRVVVDGLDVDLSKAAPERAGAGVVGAPAAAPGALAQVRLPFGLVVGELRVAGRMRLPGPDGSGPVVARVSVTGGGLAPGREGSFALKAAVEDAAPRARVRALNADGTLRLRQAADRTFDLAALAAAVDAEGPHFSAGTQLRIDASLRSGAAGASYALRLETAVGGVATPLLAISAEAPPDGARFAGTWSLRASGEQVAPFFLGGALPVFALTGEGTVSAEPAARVLGLAGRLEGEVGGLEAVDPALRALGLLRIRTEFDGAVAPGRARMARLAVDVSADKPVLEARLDRGLAVDLRAGSVEMAAGDGEVGRLRLAGVPVAWVRPFLRGIDLAGGAITGELVAGGAVQDLVVETVVPLQIQGLGAARDGKLLFRDGQVGVAGRLRLAGDGLRVEVSELALDTPAGDRVRGTGTLLLPRSPGAAVVVQAEGEANLARLLDSFAAVGAVRLAGRVDASLAPDRLELRTLRGELGNGRGRPWVSGELTRPLVLALPSGSPAGVGAADVPVGRIDLATIRLDEVTPLQAVGPVAGESSPVGFAVAARDGRLTVRAQGPWRIGGFSWGPPGSSRLTGLELRATPVLEFGGIWDWKLADGGSAIVGRDGLALVELGIEAAADTGGFRAAATFQADLAALGRQPMMAPLAALGAGRAAGELRALRTAAGVQVEGRTTLNGLVRREGNIALPIANLSLKAVREPSGRLAIEMPILLDRVGRRTDLRILAEAAAEGAGRRFDARVTGDQVELADVAALASLFRATKAAPAAAASAPTGAAPADVVPFWDGWRGRLVVDVKSLAQGRDWQAHGVGAELTMAQAGIRLERAAAAWGGSGAFAAKGELAFRGGASPYALEGGFTLSEFDAGALLRAFDPGRPPVVEGMFATTGRFVGTGRTLDDTMARVRGEFEMRSRQGVFRGLRRTTERVSVATRAVDAVAALGSLLGSDRVKGAAERVAGQAYQVDQLAQALAELPFDQLVVRARREDSLDLRVEELSLLSPEVRLSARGVVTHLADRPLLEQPLALTYQLAARGRVEQTLARLRALDGTKDDLGYSRVRDAGTISGTVGRPQPNQFFLRLAEAKLGEFLN